MLGTVLKGYYIKHGIVDLDLRRMNMRGGCYLGDCQNL